MADLEGATHTVHDFGGTGKFCTVCRMNEAGHCHAVSLALRVELAAKEAECERYKNALERVARWFGEFPQVPSRDGTEPISYGSAYGSNGERDYMRRIAYDALNPEAAE